jgi:hypothetical protein
LPHRPGRWPKFGRITTVSLTVHNLRVTLLDVQPPVWRLMRVPSAVPLSALHSIVQVAMGWQDYHLHEWQVGDDYYDDESGEDEVILGEVAPADSSFRYTYDLGDGWEHLVEVVSIDPYDGSVPPVAVLDGARAVPPEDSGGPHGYEGLLAALANPDDLDHEDAVAVYGDSLDPESFDRDQINRRLESFWRQ